MKTKGFTIIELLVVVAIISVLAALALPQYFKFVMKSKRAEAIVLLGQGHQFQMAHFSGNDQFFNMCGQVLDKNCMAITGTASNQMVIDTNQAMGLGSNLAKSKFGYEFTHWTRRNNTTGPWLNYLIWLVNDELDNDPFNDQLLIHHDFPIIIPPGTPNGIPFLWKDDVTN